MIKKVICFVFGHYWQDMTDENDYANFYFMRCLRCGKTNRGYDTLGQM